MRRFRPIDRSLIGRNAETARTARSVPGAADVTVTIGPAIATIVSSADRVLSVLSKQRSIVPSVPSIRKTGSSAAMAVADEIASAVEVPSRQEA